MNIKRKVAILILITLCGSALVWGLNSHFSEMNLEERIDEKIQEEIETDDYQITKIIDGDKSVLVLYQIKDKDETLRFWINYKKQNGELHHDFTTEIGSEEVE